MENIEQIVSSLPDFERMIRIFPITMWTLLVGGLCYFTGRHSRKEFIEHLKNQIKEHK